MMPLLRTIFDWGSRHTDWLIAMGAFSFIAFFVTLIFLPIAILRIPTDYFKNYAVPPIQETRHPALVLLIRMLKNLLGILLLLIGALMLALPGQGILTMLIGLLLTDFPGKRKIECDLVRRPAVLKTINYIRKRGHRPPLTLC
ncbi:MAG: hypothetical protein A2293_12765 [Elusimicrobia bacterium RIFOXYB2_FULL_49_7]|nr:MAG: hypothetical protein A2293_12765 [Elusimicrobia bacterium RIFOXYB2_FULL_49_7]